ncbi:MAG: hypothetical protein KDE51_11985, partial [Anaerolineales bacterium]|nr:hypothetical protein [Anaerolineales bacterium]
VTDIFIPELYFDFFYIQQGQITPLNAQTDTTVPLPQQSLKTLHSGRLTLQLTLPLVLFGARFALSFAERFWQKTLPANQFLPQQWLHEPVHDLNHFTSLVSHTVQARQKPRTAAPLLSPSLEESDWLAAYSPRHKRRLLKTTFGLSHKEMRAIDQIHQFLSQSCDFSSRNPRIIDYIDDEHFYDQPHLNNAFKKATGLSPLAYFEANSLLQDNLMAASYNELTAP